jgi:hypothetical protein
MILRLCPSCHIVEKTFFGAHLPQMHYSGEIESLSEAFSSLLDAYRQYYGSNCYCIRKLVKEAEDTTDPIQFH